MATFTCSNPGGTTNLYIDGTFVGHSPFSWNTTGYANGSHYLVCNGYRNSVLVGSDVENVTVSNGAPTATPHPPTPTPYADSKAADANSDTNAETANSDANRDADSRSGNYHQPHLGKHRFRRGDVHLLQPGRHDQPLHRRHFCRV